MTCSFPRNTLTAGANNRTMLVLCLNVSVHVRGRCQLYSVKVAWGWLHVLLSVFFLCVFSSSGRCSCTERWGAGMDDISMYVLFPWSEISFVWIVHHSSSTLECISSLCIMGPWAKMAIEEKCSFMFSFLFLYLVVKLSVSRSHCSLYWECNDIMLLRDGLYWISHKGHWSRSREPKPLCTVYNLPLQGHSIRSILLLYHCCCLVFLSLTRLHGWIAIHNGVF